jgi:purine-binding chemotaxis protein CheW
MNQSSIDWEQVRGRLRKSEEALRETLSDNPARMATVFRQRAVRLAREQAESRPVAPRIPSLIFRLGREQYAIALKDLTEVLPFQGCTRVPGAAKEFLGVMNLRGELRPVIDLARVLCRSASTDSGAVLILRRQAGLKVDSVEELREIRSDEISAPVPGQYCQAMLSGILTVLDVETLLSALLIPKEPRSL